jgi:hypothetical protein
MHITGDVFLARAVLSAYQHSQTGGRNQPDTPLDFLICRSLTDEYWHLPLPFLFLCLVQ